MLLSGNFGSAIRGIFFDLLIISIGILLIGNGVRKQWYRFNAYRRLRTSISRRDVRMSKVILPKSPDVR